MNENGLDIVDATTLTDGVESLGDMIPLIIDDVVPPPVDNILEVISVEDFLGLLEELIGTPEEIPNFMEVPFAEYSVTEGLLLLLLLSAFFAALWKIIGRVF